MSTPPDRQTHTLSYGEAIYEAVVQEMERDAGVFVLGLGVDDPKGIYGTTKDLHHRFGRDRNFDTPISEDAMTGVAIGAAMNGGRPIHVHQRMDFLMLCMNQLVNIAAKQHYMFDGAVRIPMVVRASIGRSWGQGAQHSQAFHSFFMHVPGLRVVAASTPHDAKTALVASIRDDNPVVFIEHRMLYAMSGEVPVEPVAAPLGRGRVLRPGDDVTIVGISHMVVECLRAAQQLDALGVSAEVIDPIWLAPLSMEEILASVAKTGRLLVVDNAWLTAGASAEIITRVIEHGERPVMVARLGYQPTPCPTTRVLEDAFYPSPQSIAQKAASLCGLDDVAAQLPPYSPSQEVAAFKGPF